MARLRRLVVYLARPAMAADNSFFNRWSRQKAQAKVQSPAEVSPAPVVAVPPTPESETPAPVLAVAPTPDPDPAALTLEDVAQLTPQSDFAPYMGRTVSKAVKNAAMKKLFADPHFNVMDGLDIYIDDYSIPSPLSPEDLKNMVAAQFIKLVDDPAAAPAPLAPDVMAPADALASSESEPELQPAPEPIRPNTPHGTAPHDNPDLQLQPDDAAQRPGAEPGA